MFNASLFGKGHTWGASQYLTMIENEELNARDLDCTIWLSSFRENCISLKNHRETFSDISETVEPRNFVNESKILDMFTYSN